MHSLCSPLLKRSSWLTYCPVSRSAVIIAQEPSVQVREDVDMCTCRLVSRRCWELLRKKMEVLVLSLPSGSYAQRVRAEYLKELENQDAGCLSKRRLRGLS